MILGQKPIGAKEKGRILGEIFDKHGFDITDVQFVEIFKKEYPENWKRINNAYNRQIRKSKPGNKLPMPPPDQYLKNMYNVYKKKRSE